MSFGYKDLLLDEAYNHHYPPGGLNVREVVAAVKALDAAQQAGTLPPNTVITIRK